MSGFPNDRRPARRARSGNSGRRRRPGTPGRSRSHLDDEGGFRKDAAQRREGRQADVAATAPVTGVGRPGRGMSGQATRFTNGTSDAVPADGRPATGASWIGLLGFVLLVGAVAVSAGSFRPGPWYLALDKPPWTPPDWVFAPVWTILYIGIALSGWLIFAHAPTARPRILWLLQLGFNAAWSFLFFGQHLIGVALIDIACMWITILLLIVSLFSRVFRWSRLVGLMLIPYLTWVSIAGALNFSIWLRQ